MSVILRQRRRPTFGCSTHLRIPGWRRHSLRASKEGRDSRTAPASYFGSWVTPARAPYGESRAGAGAVPLGEHQTNDGKSERLLTTLRVPPAAAPTAGRPEVERNTCNA